jgi:hypothetical protein
LVPIRVRTLELPRLVRELIELAVRSQSDMEVVEADSPPPDVVICGVPSAERPSAARSALAESARVRVLELDPAAGRASLYELHEYEHEIGEVSPDEIVDTIRAAAGRCG